MEVVITPEPDAAPTMGVCAICLDRIESPKDGYVAPCSSDKHREHRFHRACIVEYAQALITKAVKVRGKNVSVTVGALPRCPMCRSELTVAHRTPNETTFFILSKSNCLLMLGTVNDGASAPCLRLKKRPKRALA